MESNNKPVINLDQIIMNTSGKSSLPLSIIPGLLKRVEAGEIVLEMTFEMSLESVLIKYGRK